MRIYEFVLYGAKIRRKILPHSSFGGQVGGQVGEQGNKILEDTIGALKEKFGSGENSRPFRSSRFAGLRGECVIMTLGEARKVTLAVSI